ncbi:MAG TPA: 23S rRNA (uracil(1939)-C(5))-methyltransferase RlmD [Terriglobia bacterium]|nr:23S rRNA (uracil(1939)-C(5))-methyltransferase RlmD [Terriglobia bacterium]
MGFELIPQKLVFGGAALGYHQGSPVLVSRALPGEVVEAEQVRQAKGMTHARVKRIVKPAAERVQAACPYFEDCGGCQYQHFLTEKQTAWKIAILRETLSRLGGIEWTAEIPAHTAFPWNYRNQAQFKVETLPAGKARVGLFAPESHRLVDIDSCRILSPCLNKTLAGLRQLLDCDDLAGFQEIEMMTDDRDQHVMLRLCGQAPPAKAQSMGHKIFRELPQVQTVAFQRVNGEAKILGQPILVYRVGPFDYQISPGSFFQASRFLLPELAVAVTKAATGAKEQNACEAGSLALDLYAGVGLLTLPLAQHFGKVIGVEMHPGSAADLRANAQTYGSSRIEVVHRSVFDFLRRFSRPQPDLAVLDPPRSGVGYPSLKALARLRPQRIFYISCHPPTLARDLAFLLQQGYVMTSVEMFDFFPQTYHIEAFVQLRCAHR